MPKCDIDKKIFSSLYKGDLDKDSLEDILPCAKAEWDGEESDKIKIEFNDTNRPDLWSAVGLARCLNSYNGKKIREYSFFSTKNNAQDFEKREFDILQSAPSSRPYSLGFGIYGKKVDDNILKFLIQWQEKIHYNFGKKRKTISMGLYRFLDITFPVKYEGRNPEEISFVPLGETRAMNGYEVLENTEKGREFASLLENEKTFPLLSDKNGKVLSMPPVINSNDVGALKVGDSEIFVEVSGLYLKQVLLVLNMFACDMSDLGFKIRSIKVNFSSQTEFGKSIVVPYYFQSNVECKKADFDRVFGSDFDIKKAPGALKKMGVNSTLKGKSVLIAVPPFYRNDFLHPCDVVEDVAIGIGLENLGTEPIKDWTIGRLSESESMNRKIKSIMVGLGYNEMIYNYLSSEKEYVENMLINPEDVVYIDNPMSENYRVVRPSIIPSLLKTESVSQSSVYPHQIFECGKICIKDKNSTDGINTINSLGFLESSVDANFNKAVSVLNTLMYYLKKQYKIKKATDLRFIKGRCAKIYVDDKDVGIIGEISPFVLENWGVLTPCFASEINVDKLL